LILIYKLLLILSHLIVDIIKIDADQELFKSELAASAIETRR